MWLLNRSSMYQVSAEGDQRKEARLLDYCSTEIPITASWMLSSLNCRLRNEAERAAVATQFSDRLMKFYLRCDGDGERPAASAALWQTLFRLAASRTNTTYSRSQDQPAAKARRNDDVSFIGWRRAISNRIFPVMTTYRIRYRPRTSEGWTDMHYVVTANTHAFSVSLHWPLFTASDPLPIYRCSVARI